MNKEDIVRMAREAGMEVIDDRYTLLPFLERFAALVAAAEREECAQMVEHVMYGRDGCDRTAAAIRARGQMTDKQPKALWLAELLDGDTPMHCEQAATELRRLHEVNAVLVEAVKAALSDDQPYIERCKAAIAKATGENNG